MSIQDQIRQRFNEARKERNELNRKTYESVIAKITITERSGKHPLPLTDNVVISLIYKELKELEETMDNFLLAGRVDEAVRVRQQYDELVQFVPVPYSEEEVLQIIKRVVETGEINKGKIIGAVAKEVGNRFDKSKIAGLVAKAMEQ